MTAFGKAIQPFPKAVIIILSAHPQSFLHKDTKKSALSNFGNADDISPDRPERLTISLPGCEVSARKQRVPLPNASTLRACQTAGVR